MHIKHVILVCVCVTLVARQGASIYFTQPKVSVSVRWSRDGLMNLTEVLAMLEPDESGEIEYITFPAHGKQQQNCPISNISPDGRVHLKADSIRSTKPDKECRYKVGARLYGKVGMIGRETSNMTMLIRFVEGTALDDCAEHQICFGGFTKLLLQVMENSKSVKLAPFPTYHRKPACLTGSFDFSIEYSNSNVDSGVFFLGHDYPASTLRIREDLDREAIPWYDFNITCSFNGKGGIRKKAVMPGVLTVLDQDDNPPYISGNASTSVVYISLHLSKDSHVKRDRLLPRNGYEELAFYDADSEGVNSFDIVVVNDTWQLLEMNMSSVYGIPNKYGPNNTYGILKAGLMGTKISAWAGHYCVLVVVTDVTLAADRGNPNVTFNVCLHCGLEPPEKELIKPVVEKAQCGATCIAIMCLGFVFAVFCIGTVCYCVNQRTLLKRKSTPVIINAHGVPMTYRPGGGTASILSAAEEYIGPGPETNILGSTVEYFPIDTKWEVPRTALLLEGVLGEGEFGRVYKAKFQNPNDPTGSIMDVAVKMLKDVEPTSGRSCRQEFMAEFSLLKQVDHHNVIKLLGACTTGDGPCYIIMEYAEFGSLRGFLRKCRRIEAIPNGPTVGMDGEQAGKQTGGGMEGCYHDKAWDHCYTVTPKEILGFSWQIARGMAYLSEMKMVHRDLAARNVLLASGKVCKISDFGLTRDVYVDDAYKKKSKDRVPVKWLAPECLADELYTTKSDVWAYGVLLWELANMGASPYPGIPTEQLYSLLKSGYRMPQPCNCNYHLLMKKCWEDEPGHRPTFRELVSDLGVLLEDGIDYIRLNFSLVCNPEYELNGVEAPPDALESTHPTSSSSTVPCPPYQPFLGITTSTAAIASSRTKDTTGTENMAESLRLIDHENSTCACDDEQDRRDEEDRDSEYNNTFVHTYINNEPNKEEAQTSKSTPETIVPYSGSGYESPIKLRPVAY